jgi:hypothetical protein
LARNGVAKKRKAYQIRTRRKEWISLDGGDICIWEMRMQDFTLLSEYCTRPPEDPRGGVDQQEALLWQVALCCYDGEGEDAERIWPDARVREILDMPNADFDRLILEINRVNGKLARQEEIWRDFTPPAQGRRSSGSKSGASNGSGGDSPGSLIPKSLTERSAG